MTDEELVHITGTILGACMSFGFSMQSQDVNPSDGRKYLIAMIVMIGRGLAAENAKNMSCDKQFEELLKDLEHDIRCFDVLNERLVAKLAGKIFKKDN